MPRNPFSSTYPPGKIKICFGTAARNVMESGYKERRVSVEIHVVPLQGIIKKVHFFFGCTTVVRNEMEDGFEEGMSALKSTLFSRKV